MFHVSFACHPATVADPCDVGRVTIDMLPDVALLEIFDCYVNQARNKKKENIMMMMNARTQHRHGIHWCMCVENGGRLFLGHHVAWIFDFSARKQHR
jgi:hypothetical protein